MSDDGLEERLKRIRGISSTKRVREDQSLQSTRDLGANHEEVNALLQQTADEIAADKGQVEVGNQRAEEDDDENDDNDLEAWLGLESEKDENERVAITGIDDEARELTKKSNDLTRAATHALQELHCDDTLSSATTTLLQIEPKEQPVLSLSSSGEGSILQSAGIDSLEDDLAAAMADELGSRVGEGKPSQDKLEPSKVKQIDDLSSRLAQLRADSRIQSSVSHQLQDAPYAKDEESDKEVGLSFDLPSAPRTQPISIKDDDDNWRRKYGIEGRELSSYEKLARLSATSLGAPTSSKAATSASFTKVIEGKRDETDDWCCICNDDATLSCLGCDEDLYCRACWSEGHKDMDRDELIEHTTKIFSGHRRKPLAAV